MVEENADEAEGTRNEHHSIAVTPSTSHTILSPLDLNQHNPHHHSQRCRGRSSSLRDRQPPHCKSRDDEDLEEWLEEGPRSLLVPRIGMPFQTELTPVTAPSETAAVTNSDEGSMDLPTVTTEVSYEFEIALFRA